jgi:hypothetical protein
MLSRVLLLLLWRPQSPRKSLSLLLSLLPSLVKCAHLWPLMRLRGSLLRSPQQRRSTRRLRRSVL